MKTNLHHRRFSRSLGALIALPALESIGFLRFASAAARQPVTHLKRCEFFGFGYGVTPENPFFGLEAHRPGLEF